MRCAMRNVAATRPLSVMVAPRIPGACIEWHDIYEKYIDKFIICCCMTYVKLLIPYACPL